MTRIQKEEKEIVRNFLDNCNFTEFCKKCKSRGIITQRDLCDLLERYYEYSTIRRKTGQNPFGWAYRTLQCDLNRKNDYNDFVPQNLLQEMQENKNYGNYMKVLIEGNKHIYWASPVFGHQDYNKSIWRDNTAENRRKMVIINNFLTK